MPAVLTLHHLNKSFRDRSGESLTVLQDINLTIARGEIFVFVGPSGSGKSTLLRLLCGLETPSSGHVELSPGVTAANMSFVFQQFALLPWLTVADNVALGLRARHLPASKLKKQVMDELAMLGLERFADVYPRKLSGGMQQRVGIARALATDPQIILMDEAFSELDSFTADELRHDLLTIWHSRHPTIILVTHIIEEAILLADRIAILTPRPGHIEKVITNHLPRPRHPRTAAFYTMADKLYGLIKP